MTTTPTTKKPTILYLDDEENNLHSFVATFRKFYTIFAETSVQKAIDVLKNNEINLIITDQRMPEMSGVEFLKRIKKDFPTPVRMVLTGFSDVSDIIGSINDGSVLSYVTKPWNEREFKELIDIAIRIQKYETYNNQLKTKLEEAINKQKTTINLLQKYVPEDTINVILQQINNNDVQFDINNIKRNNITVLFSDIRAFTQFAEKLDPRQLLAYLNNYFNVMVKCVNNHQGVVYKFLGDGLMVLFGTKESSGNPQKQAIECALDMIKELNTLNETITKEFDHKIIIGIGIKTGEAIICHTEAENFLSYTVIGDPIDEAIQIEHMTHQTPNAILIDDNTYNIVKNENIENLTYEKFPSDKIIYRVLSKTSSPT